MEEIDFLVEEMQKTKQNYPTLEISEVLRLFSIKTMKDLTQQIRRLVDG